MPDEQRNPAVVRKLAYGIDQGIAAGVVETLGDLDPILVELIIQLQELEGLSCADRARAQDRSAAILSVRGAYLVKSASTDRTLR
jgi:hypothetical protein